MTTTTKPTPGYYLLASHLRDMANVLRELLAERDRLRGRVEIVTADLLSANAKRDALFEALEDTSDALAMRDARLTAIKEIIEGIENRCMAADGPVTNTRDEMTDVELQRIYRLAGGTVSP